MPTILAVDDQPEVLETVSRVLSRSHDVLRASSGKEALKVFKKPTVKGKYCKTPETPSDFDLAAAYKDFKRSMLRLLRA